MKSTRLAVVALACAGLLIAACGGGDTGSGGEPTDAASPTGGTGSTSQPAGAAGAAEDVGALYVGGRFRSVSQGLNYAARWDGPLDPQTWALGRWDSLADGMAGNMALDVATLLVGPDGRVYAGGAFESAGGVPAAGVAAWDGEQWQSVAPGLETAPGSPVRAMAFVGQVLYAGGSFRADPTAANPWGGLARFDPADGVPGWIFPLDGPLSGVRALAVDGGDRLYVSGALAEDTRVDVTQIWRWDGVAWVTLGEVTHDAHAWGEVNALLVDAQGHLLAGGAFTHVDGVRADGLARWDGNTWAPVGGGVRGTVYSLRLDPDGRLVVGGLFNDVGAGEGLVTARGVATWDGTAWAGVGEGGPSEARSMAVDGAGRLYVADNTAQVKVWDGAGWLALPPVASGGKVGAVLVAP